MSEPAPERVAPARRDGRGNVFTHKIGPLPMWAWVAIAGGVLVVWRWYSQSKQSQSAQQDQSSTPADQVPQFINQTYTTVTAPSAPGTTPSPTTPTPPGQPGPTTPMPVNPGGPFHPAPRPGKNIPPVGGLRSTGVGATNVHLAWNPVSGAQRYQVRVTYQDKVIKTFFTNSTSYNVTGLNPNRTYGLHVVAISGSDWAPEASIVQKTT